MKIFNEKSKNIIYIAAVIIIMFWVSQNISAGIALLGNILSVLTPVIIGGGIAFIIWLPMEVYIRLFKKIGIKKKGIIEIGSFVLSLASVVALIALLLQIVIPELMNTFGMLTETVPKTYDKIEKWVVDNQDKFPQLKEWVTGIDIDWGGLFENLLSFVTGGVAGVFDTTFSVVSLLIGGIYNMLMAFIIAIYLLLNRRRLARQVTKTFMAYLPRKVFKRIMKVGHLCKEAFSKYIMGKCLDALVIGTMTFCGMSIFGFPYAAMISVIIGVTAMIPIIGGYIGIGIGALLIVLINPVQALWFVVFMAILQTFEGNVIYPKIMGNSVGLPAMWIIIAITVGGGMFGFLGMLLAVPVMSVIYELVKESVNNRLSSRITVPVHSCSRMIGVSDDKKEDVALKEASISNADDEAQENSGGPDSGEGK